MTDTDNYTDPDDSMSLQDLARLRNDEQRDFDEEAYNQWLLNGGDH